MTRRTRKVIVFAITAHGYGHAVRALEVMRALLESHPGVEVIAAASLAEAAVRRFARVPFRHLQREYEPGAVQPSCFDVDQRATRRAYEDHLQSRAEQLEREISFLTECGARGLVSDIPALPVRAAGELGIPAVGVANFTWDWILEPLLGPSGEPVLAQLREDYGSGTLYLRLPLGPRGSPFPRSEDMPFVARRARRSPEEVRAVLGLPPPGQAPLALVCAGGMGGRHWPAIEIQDCRDVWFAVVGDLPIQGRGPLVHLPDELLPGISFPDLVAAADVVVSKPGYGTASECLAAGTALVGVERRGFRETPVLVEEYRRYGPYADLSLEDFFAGRWEPSLRAALACTGPFVLVRTDGAGAVAMRLGEVFEL